MPTDWLDLLHDVADAVADAVAQEAKRQGTTNVRGDEVGYTRGETTEFRAIRL